MKRNFFGLGGQGNGGCLLFFNHIDHSCFLLHLFCLVPHLSRWGQGVLFFFFSFFFPLLSFLGGGGPRVLGSTVTRPRVGDPGRPGRNVTCRPGRAARWPPSKVCGSQPGHTLAGRELKHGHNGRRRLNENPRHGLRLLRLPGPCRPGQ